MVSVFRSFGRLSTILDSKWYGLPLKRTGYVMETLVHFSITTYRNRNTILGSPSTVSYQSADLRADQLLSDLWQQNNMKTMVKFRCAVEDDIKFLLELVREQDWWYSGFEFSVLLKLDPYSLTVASNEQNIPVGFIGICNVLPGIIYNGPYIVRKDHRGLGIGKVFYNAMKLLQANNNGCMDLDQDRIEKYAEKGFIYKSYKFNCFQGIVNDKCKLKPKSQLKCNITHISYNELPFVFDYDKKVYKGLDRARILQACLFDKNVHSAMAIDDGKVAGYGCLIKCTKTNNYSIYSLFADNDIIADNILEKLLEDIPNGAILTIQLLTDKQLFERLYHFKFCFQMQRVFNNYRIETDLERMYFVNDVML